MSSNQSSSAPSAHQAWLVVAGGVLVHLTLGTFYTWGNLTLYVLSYMRLKEGVEVRASDAAWVSAAMFTGMGALMPFGGVLERKVGPRWSTLAGGMLMCLGLLLSRFALNSLPMFLVTYGLMNGGGIGLAYTSPLVACLRWLPEKKGLVSGIITAGFGAGALVFNQVQTLYCNPNNAKPDTPVPGEATKLFSDEEVLQRVPDMFILLAAVYFTLQVVGLCLIRDPPTAAAPATVAPVADNAKQALSAPLLAVSHTPSGVDRAVSKQMVLDTSASALNVFAQGRRASMKQLDDSQPLLSHLTPGQAVLTRQFVLLWVMFVFNGLAISFASTFWKNMSMVNGTSVLSDRMLSVVGSVASLCNAGGRLTWGSLADRHAFRHCIMALSVLWAVLLGVFSLAASFHPIAYCLVVCMNFFCLGGNMSMFPAATTSVFGRTYLGTIYGFVFASQIVASISSAFLANKLLNALGPLNTSLLMSGFVLATTALAYMLPLFGVSYPTNGLALANQKKAKQEAADAKVAPGVHETRVYVPPAVSVNGGKNDA